jgi:hypothetical protein
MQRKIGDARALHIVDLMLSIVSFFHLSANGAHLVERASRCHEKWIERGVAAT